MRVNVYSQELTSEVIEVEKVSNTGRAYKAAQLILRSSEALHHPPDDDDRSAVTFWLPGSVQRCEEMAQAFEEIAAIFRGCLTPRQTAQFWRNDAINAAADIANRHGEYSIRDSILALKSPEP